MCDLVQTLHMERIERRVLAERQMAMHLIGAGIDVDLPDLQEAWDEFDAALCDTSKPDRADRDRDDLLRALGIRP